MAIITARWSCTMAFQPSTVPGFQPLLPAIVGFEVLQQLILLDMPQHLEQILHFLPAMERSAVWPWELMGDKVIQPHRKKSTGNIQKKCRADMDFLPRHSCNQHSPHLSVGCSCSHSSCSSIPYLGHHGF